jgi:CheY-like chemotaxis protein
VFWNVLKNAVKFTPQGGRITLTTTVSPNGEIFVAKVTDTGIGISPAEIEVIFDAFAQGDHAKGLGTHRFGGLGLGLAISRKLIEMHSGRIFAKSEGQNRGSTFIVEIPLEHPAALGPGGPAPQENARPHDPPPDASGPRRTILLVEDHDPTRAALERLLQRRNFRVLTSATAFGARRIAESEKVDLVISDIGLPDGNGYELMAELEERHHLKGIALTGYGIDGDAASIRGSSFAVQLLKPVSMQALDAAIAATAPAVTQG